MDDMVEDNLLKSDYINSTLSIFKFVVLVCTNCETSRNQKDEIKSNMYDVRRRI